MIKPSGFVLLLAALNRLKVHPPSLSDTEADARENQDKIESISHLIVRFVERRLEGIRDDPPSRHKDNLLQLLQNARKLRRLARAALRSRHFSQLDKLRTAYDTVGNSLKQVAQGEEGSLASVVDVVLNLPLPV